MAIKVNRGILSPAGNKKEINSNLDLTFLTDEQVFGVSKLDIFKKYGTRCAITDFAILLGGYVSVDYCTIEGDSLENRTGWWWMKTEEDNDVCVVDIMGSSTWEWVTGRDGGARPALPYSSILAGSSNGVRGINGILEVEYGEYPQDIAAVGLSEKLEIAFLKKTLKETGKSYRTDSVDCRSYDTRFRTRIHIEYEYNGRKYIRFIGDKNGFKSILLSDGREVKLGEAYWVEVKPIKWMIDEEADIALSKKIIVSGLQFDSKKKYRGNFEKTDIKKFMDTFLIKDIQPSKVINNKDEQLNDEDFSHEEKIIMEIKRQLEKIKDQEEFIEKIADKVNGYLDEYNKKVEAFGEHGSLILGSEMIDSLRNKCLLNLEMILENVKQMVKSVTKYYEFLDYLGELEKILDKEDVLINTELKKDFYTISTCSISFLDELSQSEIKDLFKNILITEKNRINLHINNLFYHNNNEIDDMYDNVGEFELDIRRGIHPVLTLLNSRVLKQNIDIDVDAIIKNTYQKEKTDALNFYIELINNLYQVIREKYSLTTDETKKLLQIIKTEIDTEKNVGEVLEQLTKIIINLYQFQFDLEHEENKKQIKENSYIKVRI